MRTMLGRVLSWFGKKPKPAIWESIGSPSYRRAVKQIRYTSIRRAAWDGKRVLYLYEPRKDGR
jgi:hypothetical protein